MVLKLSQSFFTFLLIVLHGLAHVVGDILGVKHVGAEVKYCLPVDLRVAFIIGCVQIVVVLHKVRDSINKVTFLNLRTETLFGEVRQTDEDVHEDS